MDDPLESTGLLRQDQPLQLFDRRDYGAHSVKEEVPPDAQHQFP
jgi:hypothetical protein